MPGVYVVSLGCPKNRVDTEEMLGQLLGRGWKVVGRASAAELLLVNTCAFITPAVREAERIIAGLARRKRAGQKLVVCGCLVNRYPERGMTYDGAVDAWLNIADEKRLAAVVERWFPRARKERKDVRVRTTPQHYAYLRIADGCNHRCSYCTIPQIRGRYRSVPLARVIDEARRLVDQGVVELNLIAQDTGAYGHDLRPRTTLVKLLECLAELRGLWWLRVQYVHPTSVTDDLLRMYSTLPVLCPYLDMPLQHISDRVLRSMGRPGTAWTRALLERVRELAPHVAVRTTFITGYPGETPEEFRELVKFVEEQRFAHVGVFAYSREEGTRAADLPAQIARATALRRRGRLMRTQQAIALARHRAMIGSVIEVLIDERTPDGSARGRRRIDAPEVDATVHVNAHARCVPGAIVPVRITGAGPYDLYGTFAGDSGT